MTRVAIPLHITDLSHFARAMARELPDTAGHQSWLNMLSRAGGYKNWQHLRAASGDHDPEPAPDMARLRRALRYFDAEGRLLRFPGKTALQMLCLWPIWARIAPRTPLSERALSAQIDTMTCFRDAAQIRRSMVEGKMMTRTRDGSCYTRIEQRPSPEARALIARLGDLG